MCGIFGYSGTKQNAGEIVLEGLKRLDYRGYDSWGIAVNTSDKVLVEKQVGKISEITNLNLPQSSTAIAHTRWATTGAVTQPNAHPHLSTDKSFALAQNGIVENYDELKHKLLEKGYTFISETDTEVIVRLIEDNLKTNKNLKEAVAQTFEELEGRNTIILVTNDNQIIAARNGSPLVIGMNPDTNEVYLSSDTLSFAEHAKKVIVVDNGHMAHVNGQIKLFNMKKKKEVPYEFEDIGIASSKVDKQKYDHFMIKEISETPQAILQLTKQNKNAYFTLANAIKTAKHVYTIGSGTAGVAAAQIAFYLRHIGKIKAVSLVGADANEYCELFTKDDLLIAPSQSGETADVLEVLEYAKKHGVKIASFVNMPGSMMTRMSDYKFMAEAGPEICVMSTKIFTSQIAWGYLVAKTVVGQLKEGRQNLIILAQEIKSYLHDQKSHAQVKTIAKYLENKHDIFLLGKYQNFQIIREGMVKLIEGTYKHAHAIPAGDLKHYAITLMEKGVPVIVALSNDATKHDLLNAISQVKARGAEVIGIAPEKEELFDYFISVPDTGETSAILNIIPLQLLAYHMAVALGNNVDKPRNIAKSVTVK